MQSLDLANDYTLSLSEMSRRSQLAISSWFNEWFLSTRGADKLQTVSAISTQVILHSRLTLSRNGERLPDGVYTIEEGMVIALPLTETSLNDLPASLVAWMIDAAGRENAGTLANFLAGIRTATTNGKMAFARLSVSGLSNRSIPPL